jgi:hypothetical protein
VYHRYSNTPPHLNILLQTFQKYSQTILDKTLGEKNTQTVQVGVYKNSLYYSIAICIRRWLALVGTWSTLVVVGRHWLSLVVVGRRWSALGRRWSALGRRWSVLGRCWSVLGRCWSVLGRRSSALPPQMVRFSSCSCLLLLIFVRGGGGGLKTCCFQRANRGCTYTSTQTDLRLAWIVHAWVLA